MRLIDADVLIEKIDKFLCKSCSSYHGVSCSCCKVDDVNDIIMESPTVDMWIPVSERMPEEKNRQSEEVLVAIQIQNSVKNIVYYRLDFAMGGEWVRYGSYNITHWMPMPELPKEEE